MAAEVLFLLPVTAAIGGYGLLAIFALAIAIHAVHGDVSSLESLVVYGVAVLATLAYRDGGR